MIWFPETFVQGFFILYFFVLLLEQLNGYKKQNHNDIWTKNQNTWTNQCVLEMFHFAEKSDEIKKCKKIKKIKSDEKLVSSDFHQISSDIILFFKSFKSFISSDCFWWNPWFQWRSWVNCWLTKQISMNNFMKILMKNLHEKHEKSMKQLHEKCHEKYWYINFIFNIYKNILYLYIIYLKYLIDLKYYSIQSSNSWLLKFF